MQEEEADPGHLDKSLQGSRPARLLPRDKRKALFLRGTDTGLISSCAGSISVSQRQAREGGSSNGAVSVPKHPTKISPSQLLKEGAVTRVYFAQETGETFFHLGVEK